MASRAETSTETSAHRSVDAQSPEVFNQPTVVQQHPGASPRAQQSHVPDPSTPGRETVSNDQNTPHTPVAGDLHSPEDSPEDLSPLTRARPTPRSRMRATLKGLPGFIKTETAKLRRKAGKHGAELKRKFREQRGKALARLRELLSFPASNLSASSMSS